MGLPQFDVTVRGSALLDNGLTEWQTVEGLGLLTNGLIWPCSSIWYGPLMSTGATMVSTSWSLMAQTSTSWSDVGAGVSTAWTPSNTNNIEEC